jgi:hypothetical protein
MRLPHPDKSGFAMTLREPNDIRRNPVNWAYYPSNICQGVSFARVTVNSTVTEVLPATEALPFIK